MIPSCFRIQAIHGCGNGLVSTRHIDSGELIFKEKPCVWNSFLKGNEVSSRLFCYSCGKLLHELEVCNCSNCQIKFCSAECEQEAEMNGHKWLCSSYCAGGIIEQLSLTDGKGHIILAFIVYAKIAQKMLDNDFEDVQIEESAILAAHEILQDTHAEDFCQALHAVRTGNIIKVEETLFDELIAPAYFQNHLAQPLETLTQIFLTNSCWGGNSNKAQAFANSGIFREVFFRNLIGTFAVNNHRIHLEQEGKSLTGTGLYYILSKMNHSCVCNTVNVSAKNSVEVELYATQDIVAGEEITSTYLHSNDPDSLTRKERARALLQYLFTCQCPVCTKENENTSDENDSDY